MMYEVLNLIQKNKHRLTKQQYKTLLAGDVQGALKGLNKILRRGK